MFSTGTTLLELARDVPCAVGLFTDALVMRERLRADDDEGVLNTARNAAARLFEAGAVDEATALLVAARMRWADEDAARDEQLVALDETIAALRRGDRAAVIADTELADE